MSSYCKIQDMPFILTISSYTTCVKTLTRHYDTFGRTVGYSVEDDRKQSIVYSPTTGRIAEADGFRWEYLANSNLKSKLTYPSGAMASWDYETKRDLLTKVTNAHADDTEIIASAIK